MEIIDAEDLISLIRTNLASRKRDLKVEYRRLLDMFDELDCGANLAVYISSKISEQQRKVNNLYDECIRLEEQLGNPLPPGVKRSSYEKRI